jgi:hypothetical protein
MTGPSSCSDIPIGLGRNKKTIYLQGELYNVPDHTSDVSLHHDDARDYVIKQIHNDDKPKIHRPQRTYQKEKEQ